MKWISVKDKLPEENKYVLIYVPNKPWRDSEDNIGLFFRVAKFIKGISKEERKKTGNIYYRFCDEHGNKLKPYAWDEFGTSCHFGQDVTHWMPLPEAPEL